MYHVTMIFQEDDFKSKMTILLYNVSTPRKLLTVKLQKDFSVFAFSMYMYMYLCADLCLCLFKLFKLHAF